MKRILLIGIIISTLAGCALFRAPVKVAGKAAKTGVKVTGKAAKGTVKAVVPDGE